MRLTPAIKTLLIINMVVYVIAYWVAPMVPLEGHVDWFVMKNALHPFGSAGFHFYQYITYMFMHGGFGHLFFNMWSLMVFGCAVEQQLGTKRFWWFYILSGIGAAMVHQLLAAMGIIYNASLVGASGAIYGVMAAAAYFFPNAQLFIIPIPFPVKLKYLVLGYIVIEMYLGLTSSENVAHFAHLGGILVGVLLLLWWKRSEKKRKGRNTDFDNYWTSTSSNGSRYDREQSLWGRMKEGVTGKKKPKMRVTEVHASETNAADHVYNEKRKQENAQIDLILDKIRKNGYQNLSDEEKTVLFNASQRK